MKFTLNLVPVVLCITALGLVGCTPKESDSDTSTASHTEEHVHPESFAAAIDTLIEQKDAIATAFAAGEPESAHNPLHEIGHTLELIPDLAKKAGLGEEALQSVSSATEELYDAFGKLDEVLHGGEQISYDDVKDSITAAMTSLSSVAPADEHSGEHGSHNSEHTEGDHGDEQASGHGEHGGDHKD